MMWVDTSTREGKRPQAGDRILCHPTIDRYTTASPLPIFIPLERKRRHVGAENMYRYSTIHVFGLTFWQIQPINLCVGITFPKPACGPITMIPNQGFTTRRSLGWCRVSQEVLKLNMQGRTWHGNYSGNDGHVVNQAYLIQNLDIATCRVQR